MAKSDKAASGYAAWKDSFPDFTLIVGGKELKCHKSFLSMNSPVLKSMLTIDYKETKSNRMEIRNFDEETVANFLPSEGPPPHPGPIESRSRGRRHWR